MGLVFNEKNVFRPVIELKSAKALTLTNVRLLKSLGFKVNTFHDVGYRKSRRV